MDDFIGFSFGGVHSSTLGIVRTSDGSRYNQDLLPPSQDKTVQVPGGDGLYYFGTNYKERQFQVSFAFDSLTESLMRDLINTFNSKELKRLVFDEAPFKYYMAKVSDTLQLKYICFDEGGQRVYKGEGTLNFIAYYPFARSVYKILDDYDIYNYPNKEQWKSFTGMMESNEMCYYHNDMQTIAFTNTSEVEKDYYIYMPFNNNISLPTSNAKILFIGEITKYPQNNLSNNSSDNYEIIDSTNNSEAYKVFNSNNSLNSFPQSDSPIQQITLHFKNLNIFDILIEINDTNDPCWTHFELDASKNGVEWTNIGDFTPDENNLYVCNSNKNIIMGYDPQIFYSWFRLKFIKNTQNLEINNISISGIPLNTIEFGQNISKTNFLDASHIRLNSLSGQLEIGKYYKEYNKFTPCFEYNLVATTPINEYQITKIPPGNSLISLDFPSFSPEYYNLYFDKIEILDNSLDNINENPIYLFNPGQLETDFNIYFEFNGQISLQKIQMDRGELESPILQEGTVYSNNNIILTDPNNPSPSLPLTLNFISSPIMKKNNNDTHIRINSKSNLIEGGYFENNNIKYGKFILTGSLYNSYIESGDFFKIPVGKSFLTIISPGNTLRSSKIEYDYLYY